MITTQGNIRTYMYQCGMYFCGYWFIKTQQTNKNPLVPSSLLYMYVSSLWLIHSLNLLASLDVIYQFVYTAELYSIQVCMCVCMYTYIWIDRNKYTQNDHHPPWLVTRIPIPSPFLCLFPPPPHSVFFFNWWVGFFLHLCLCSNNVSCTHKGHRGSFPPTA
jgi:hypothetical protein